MADSTAVGDASARGSVDDADEQEGKTQQLINKRMESQHIGCCDGCGDC